MTWTDQVTSANLTLRGISSRDQRQYTVVLLERQDLLEELAEDDEELCKRLSEEIVDEESHERIVLPDPVTTFSLTRRGRDHKLVRATPCRLKNRAHRQGDKIYGLTIRNAAGDHYELSVEHPLHYIAIPNVCCKDRLFYRYQGDRRFRERPVQLKRGIIAVLPPRDSARQIYYGAAVGAGFWDPVPGVGNVRLPWLPFGYFQAALRWHPLTRTEQSFFFELHVNYAISEWPYVTISGPENSDRNVSHLYRNRMLFELAAAMTPGDGRFEIGVSAGVGFSWPVHMSDAPYIGQRDVFFSGSGFFRFNIRRWLVFETSFLRIGGAPELVNIFDAEDFTGEYSQRTHQAVTIGFDLGLRIWI